MARKHASRESRTLQASDLKRLPWRSIGPAIMGGRISDLCFKPGEPKTVYVGYATGGLWVTENMGTTFRPLFDDQETCSIGAVVCCGEEGKTVWLGTGEGNGRNSSSWGNGVYRSDDAGKTWKHLGLEDSHDIPRMAVHPTNSDICFVAALGHLWGENQMRGLYRTTDGGASWQQMLGIDPRTGCCDVAIDPNDPNTIYAAMYMRRRTAYSFESGGPEGGIYKSTDGGETWRKLAGGLPKQTGRIGLDLLHKNPQHLMAVVESTETGGNSIRDDRMRGGGVFVSTDGGENWDRRSIRSPRAFYFSKIKMDPNNPERVYLLGWTTEISDDGGRTFRESTTNLLHADHHAILINPNDSDHILIGTDGGLSQSFDKGKTWDFLNTMATGQFYNIALDNSDPYRVMGGLQDNGTWVGPSSTGFEDPEDKAAGVTPTGITNADWKTVFWGDGFHCAFDPEDADLFYAEWQGGNLGSINFRTGEKQYLSPQAREGQPRHRFNWNSPFFLSTHAPHALYLGGNYIFRFTNKGRDWERISGDLTTNDPLKMETVGSNAETHCTVVSLAESPLVEGRLWAGSDDGLIHLRPESGAEWVDVTPAEVAGGYISRLHPSAFEADRVYATVDHHRNGDMRPHILVSDDLGQSWRDITSDLPKGRSVHVLREDLSNPEVLYCGTEGGLFVSLNRGGEWVKMHGKALPTVPINDIQQHPRETDLVLGTHGRSIWVLDDASVFGQLSAEVMEKSLHLFTVRPARPEWKLHYNGIWSHKVFRAPNAPAGVRVWYWLAETLDDPVKIVFEDANGVLQKEMSGSNIAGLHRVTWDLKPEEWLQCADQGEDPFMPFHLRPGQYKVKLSSGELNAEGMFEVLARRT